MNLDSSDEAVSPSNIPVEDEKDESNVPKPSIGLSKRKKDILDSENSDMSDEDFDPRSLKTKLNKEDYYKDDDELDRGLFKKQDSGLGFKMHKVISAEPQLQSPFRNQDPYDNEPGTSLFRKGGLGNNQCNLSESSSDRESNAIRNTPKILTKPDVSRTLSFADNKPTMKLITKIVSTSQDQENSINLQPDSALSFAKGSSNFNITASDKE